MMDASDTDDDYENMEESLTLPNKSQPKLCNLPYSEIYFSSQPAKETQKDSEGFVKSAENSIVYSEVQFDNKEYENVMDRNEKCLNVASVGTSVNEDKDTVTADDYIFMNAPPKLPTKFGDEGHRKKVTTKLNNDFAGDYCRLLDSKTHGKSLQQIPRYKTKNRREILQFTDITILEDRRIVLITVCGKILVLNQEGTYIFTENFDAAFDKCTAIGRDEIAVSCGFQVRIFSVHDMDVTENIEKCFDYQYDSTTVHGISHKGHSLLMSCNLQTVDSSQSPELKLVDLKRKSTKTISCSGFKFPGIVLLHSDCKTLFVADQIQQTVTSLDDDGKVLWENVEDNNPTSLTIADDVLAVAYENFSRIKCFSTSNGNFLKGIDTEVSISINICLSNNSSQIIICPCEHPAGEMFDFVVFAPLKYVRKRRFSSKLSKLWFH